MLARFMRHYSTRTGLPQAVSLDAGFRKISEPWSPAVGGDINNFQVKLAKFQDEFVWHHHEEEDELFLVHRGAIRMHMRDANGDESHTDVSAGEFIIVPRMLEHKPANLSDTPAEVVLLEPATTLNTGSAAESTEAVGRGLTKDKLTPLDLDA